MRAANGLHQLTKCKMPPLQKRMAEDALLLYDLVGNTGELSELATSITDALGWPRTNVSDELDDTVRISK